MSQNKREIALITQLLHESRLYKSGNEFKQLLDFVVKLPNFAPFNAFMLQLQKPGLLFAASEAEWWNKFRRRIKEGARPLIILWPFSPIALVYDCDDTEGNTPLPDCIAHAFRATGSMTLIELKKLFPLALRSGIEIKQIEYGDGHAGHIQGFYRSEEAKKKHSYQVRLNQSHDPNVQFSTLAHELAHLYLGHLGYDKYLKIIDRSNVAPDTKELEAEAVGYIVSNRNGIKPHSESYLANYVSNNLAVNDMDLYAILKAAGQIETLLGLATHTSFEKLPHQTNLF